MLKSQLATIKNKLDPLKAFDHRENINVYCDQLECDVLEAFESAIKHFNQIEQEMLKEIQEYRQICLDAWSARDHERPESTEKGSQSADIQKKLDALSKELGEFTTKWDAYFNQSEVTATDSEIFSASSKAADYLKRMRTIKTAIKSQTFGGKLMVFKPHVSFFDDKKHLKEIFNFRLGYESTREVRIQSSPSIFISSQTTDLISAVFVADGRLASCSKDKTIKIWNTSDGTNVLELQGHTSGVVSLALLPNGWLASGSSDMTIRIWDLAKNKAIRTLRGHTKSVISMHVLKSGNLASYSIDDTIRIWNPYRTADNLLMTIKGHGNRKWLIPFGVLSNDYLVTGSKDKDLQEECVMRVWNPSNGRIVKAMPVGLEVLNTILGLSNDQVVLGFAGGTIKLIDWTDESESRTKEMAYELTVSSFAQLSNGSLVSSGTDGNKVQSIKLWELRDLTLLQCVPTDHDGYIEYIVVSPDETFLASASWDSTIKLWAIESKAI